MPGDNRRSCRCFASSMACLCFLVQKEMGRRNTSIQRLKGLTPVSSKSIKEWCFQEGVSNTLRCSWQGGCFHPRRLYKYGGSVWKQELEQVWWGYTTEVVCLLPKKEPGRCKSIAKLLVDVKGAQVSLRNFQWNKQTKKKKATDWKWRTGKKNAGDTM